MKLLTIICNVFFSANCKLGFPFSQRYYTYLLKKKFRNVYVNVEIYWPKYLPLYSILLKKKQKATFIFSSHPTKSYMK